MRNEKAHPTLLHPKQELLSRVALRRYLDFISLSPAIPRERSYLVAL